MEDVKSYKAFDTVDVEDHFMIQLGYFERMTYALLFEYVKVFYT